MDKLTPIGPNECPRCPGQHHWPHQCSMTHDPQIMTSLNEAVELASNIDALICGHGRAAILHALAMVAGDVLADADDLEGNLTLIADTARRRALKETIDNG